MLLVSFIIFILCSILFVFSVFLFRNYRNNFNYWKCVGVPYLRPCPVFGNSLKSALALVSNSRAQRTIYEKALNYVGIYLMNRPVLFVKQPRLITDILVKAFPYFPSRGLTISKDPMSANLVTLEGDTEWQFLRNRLATALSSLNVKTMFSNIKNNADNLISYLDTNYVSIGRPFDAEEVTARFTTDVISECLFGLCDNALIDSKTRLYSIGRHIFTPSYAYKAKILLRSICPKIYSWFKFKPRSLEDVSKFLDYIENAIQIDKKIRSNNILDVLLKLKNCQNDILDGNLENLNINQIKYKENMEFLREKTLESNCFALFVAGYITTSLTLSYCLYSLADNQTVQEKLYEEMEKLLSRHPGDQLNYEDVKSCSYLDQIVLETLRLYPPAISLERKCCRNFELDSSSYVVEKGTILTIPVYSLQRDPQHFVNPHRFIPERFAKENWSKITKGTFLPFGDGPRSCIGRHLALLEMKTVLGLLVLNFQFTIDPRTRSPLEFSEKTFLLLPKNGIWLNVKQRNKT